jgi:hypothetical protein
MIKKDRLSVEHHLTRLSLKQQGQLRMKMDAINKQRQRTLMLLTDYKDELTPEQFQLLNEHLKAMELRELLCSTDETLKEIRNNESLTARDRIRLTKETRDEHQIKLKALQVNQSISTDTAFDSLLMDSIIQRENTEQVESKTGTEQAQVEVKTEQEQNKPLWSDGVHIPGIHPRRPESQPRVYIENQSFITAQNISIMIASPGTGKSSLCESILSNVLNNDCKHLGFYVDSEVKRAVFFDCERDASLIDRSNDRMLKRAGVDEHHNRAIIVGLREVFAVSDKKQKIVDVIEFIKPQLILLDGVADLMSNTNSEDDTNEVYNWMNQLCIKYEIAIITTLHPNKGTDTARGWIGSEMLRRCEGVASVRENVDEVRTIKITKARDSGKPQASFKWCKDTGTMISCDSPKTGVTKQPKIIDALTIYQLEQMKAGMCWMDEDKTIKKGWKFGEFETAVKQYLKEEHPGINAGTNHIGKFIKDMCLDNKHLLKDGKTPNTKYIIQMIDFENENQ